MEHGSHPELLPHLQLDELLAELQARLQIVLATRDRMRALLEAVVAIGSGLDLESTLRRVVEAAVGLVDATYGALGVIGEGDGKRLAEFIPVGLSQEVVHGHPGRALVGLSARADLVVIGRHAKHPERQGPGSARNALLSHAHGPVAVVPS